MSPRRDPFEKLKAGEGEPAAHIPPAPSKARRNREWEKTHKTAVVTSRNVPPELQAEVKAVATELGVAVGDVARALLQHGLAEYRAGRLRLEPKLRTGKLSLFPEER